MEDRLAPAVITVTTTADDITPNDGWVSLREALTAINAGNNLGDPDITAQNPGTFGSLDTIKFNIPWNDPGNGHVYYQNSLGNVQPVPAGTSSDAGLTDAPLQWPHSWWSIRPLSALPTIRQPVFIDGYHQEGAVRNTNGPGLGINAVLRIELTGTAGVGTGLFLSNVGSPAFSTGARVRGLVINNFTGLGIRVDGGGGHRFDGNFIGTDPSGTLAQGNAARGVTIQSSSRFNLIGTDGDGLDDAAERNLISGNGGTSFGSAIFLLGAADNVIAGNFIGIDRTGSQELGNITQAIIIFRDGADRNRIGTDGNGVSDDLERNIISGTKGTGPLPAGFPYGIHIHDAVHDNVVAGNYIGTDVTGTKAIGNALWGVVLASLPFNNRIGTDADGVNDAAERNVISGNGLGGVLVAQVANNNTVWGNYIGTNAAGTDALTGGPYHSDFGVAITLGGKANQIGGEGARANVIAFNAGAGVAVVEDSISPTGFACDQVGNCGVGVPPFPTPGTENAKVNQNSVRGNAFHSNGGLGIDLGGIFSWDTFRIASDGVTPNDLGDADTGPNHLQNFPVLTAATFGPTTTTVSGTLNSLTNATFTLDFYASPVADEGKYYLGSTTVTTDGSGNASFNNVSLTTPAIMGDVVRVITATATLMVDHDDNPSTPLVPRDTSEFSAAFTLSDITVFGTPGDDIYELRAHSSGAVEVFRNSVSQGIATKVSVSDPAGSDTYTVDFGGWTGNISLVDTGTTGTDVLVVNGTMADDTLNKEAGFIEWKLTTDSDFQTRVDFSGFESVTLNAGVGNDTVHDPGTNTTILGGPGDDTIIITATFGDGVTIDGGDGSDTYIVLLGSLAGPVTVTDSGTTGTDTLTIQGTANDDQFRLSATQVTLQEETIAYDATIENLIIDGGAGADLVTVDAELPPQVAVHLVSASLSVQIDIKPGVSPNTINLGSNGTVPVAVLSTATFDAAAVDPLTVTLSGAAVRLRGNGTPQVSLEDVNADGRSDLVVHVSTEALELTDSDVQAVLEGQTYGGLRIQGTDTVRIVNGLHAAAAGPASAVARLTPAEAEAMARHARGRWADALGSPDLSSLAVVVEDLPGNLLGTTAGKVITLDVNAAGWGWFVDPTPWDDREFTTPGDQGEQNRMDLLTVLAHELGHLLGLDHDEVGVMQETLPAGARLLPAAPHEETLSGDFVPSVPGGASLAALDHTLARAASRPQLDWDDIALALALDGDARRKERR